MDLKTRFKARNGWIQKSANLFTAPEILSNLRGQSFPRACTPVAPAQACSPFAAHGAMQPQSKQRFHRRIHKATIKPGLQRFISMRLEIHSHSILGRHAKLCFYRSEIKRVMQEAREREDSCIIEVTGGLSTTLNSRGLVMNESHEGAAFVGRLVMLLADTESREECVIVAIANFAPAVLLPSWRILSQIISACDLISLATTNLLVSAAKNGPRFFARNVGRPFITN